MLKIEVDGKILKIREPRKRKMVKVELDGKIYEVDEHVANLMVEVVILAYERDAKKYEPGELRSPAISD